MSREYIDGTFSPDLPIEESFEKFWEEIQDGIPVRSLHVGTEKELDEIKGKVDLQSQIDELRAKIEENESLKSDSIDILTDKQIKAFQSIKVKTS